MTECRRVVRLKWHIGMLDNGIKRLRQGILRSFEKGDKRDKAYAGYVRPR